MEPIKIKKERLKAAGVAVLGAVGISAAVKNIKNTLESEYGKNDKKKINGTNKD